MLALDDLRDAIVPRLADQQAAVKAKGLARLVKYWRDCERYGPALNASEAAAISAALGRDFVDHAAAWAGFCAAIEEGTLPLDLAIRLCYGHVAREALLMADATGSLASTRFAPLD